MIKQRTCCYLWLLLTCDLRCATLTLKNNVDLHLDCFFLYCECYVCDDQECIVMIADI